MKLFKCMLLAAVLVALGCSSNDSDSTTNDNQVAGNDDQNSDTNDNDCTNASSVFSIDLDPTACSIDIQTVLGTASGYEESITGTTRSISINGVANHLVGEFPNSGNPNTIAVTNENYFMTSEPQIASETIIGQGYTAGILFSGVAVDPYTAEFFIGSNGTTNTDWNITALQATSNLGLDCNNAHVQPTGRYHYHGTPSNYIFNQNIDGSQMVKVGYAADGFPIYYKYAYADDGVNIEPLESGYQLKTEPRGGDGVTAPNGCPDGYYFQDYEYVNGISPLDECNGRFGKTPESDDEYYYVITDNFPSSPLCFSGTPDDSFRIGG